MKFKLVVTVLLLATLATSAVAQIDPAPRRTTTPSTPITNSTPDINPVPNPPTQLSKDDFIEALKLINMAKAMEAALYRRQQEMDRELAEIGNQLNDSQAKFNQWTTTKRKVYKVSDKHNIDPTRGVWVDYEQEAKDRQAAQAASKAMTEAVRVQQEGK